MQQLSAAGRKVSWQARNRWRGNEGMRVLEENITLLKKTLEKLLIGRKEHWKEGEKGNRGLISQERKGLESKK